MRSPQSLDLSGRVALVTGGSQGIGLAIAEGLLDAGASVVITGRDQAHLDAARGKLSGSGDDRGKRVHAVRADVGKEKEAGGAVAGAIERFGGVDILVNNAGVGNFANVADMEPRRGSRSSTRT